jgi:hypothetical protein
MFLFNKKNISGFLSASLMWAKLFIQLIGLALCPMPCIYNAKTRFLNFLNALGMAFSNLGVLGYTICIILFIKLITGYGLPK